MTSQESEQYWSPPPTEPVAASALTTPMASPAAPTTPLAPPTAPTTPIANPAALTTPVLPAPPLAPTVPHPNPRHPVAANQPTINLASPAPGELLRFGPGVPVPATTTPDMTQAIAAWRGEATPAEDTSPRRRRRRLLSWLLPLLVLIAVIAILLWQRSGSQLSVTDAAVHAASPTLTCDGTANVAATIHTNGAAGTITYRWRRSDGTVSDALRQQVTKGSTNVQVVLLWSFHGQGSMNATATLEVLSPSQLTASTTFIYTCR